MPDELDVYEYLGASVWFQVSVADSGCDLVLAEFQLDGVVVHSEVLDPCSDTISYIHYFEEIGPKNLEFFVYDGNGDSATRLWVVRGMVYHTWTPEPTHTPTSTPTVTPTATTVGCPDLPLTCERWGSDASEVWVPVSQRLELTSVARDSCCDIKESRWYLDHATEIFHDDFSGWHQCASMSGLWYTFDAPGDHNIECLWSDDVGHTCTLEWLVHVVSSTATPTATPTSAAPTATHTPGKPPRPTATPQPLNLFPTALEVTQAIQTLDPAQPQVPLVKDKATFVRFYIGQSRPVLVPAYATLNAYRGGAHIAPYDLRAVSSEGVILTSSSQSRADVNDSFLFRLPDEWCTGTIELRAEVNPDHRRVETDYGDNVMIRMVSFNPRSPVALKMVSVRTDPQTATVADPGFWDIIEWMEAAYPVPSVTVYDSGNTLKELETCYYNPPVGFPVPYPCYGPYEMPEDSALVLTNLWTMNFLTDDSHNGGDGVIYVGMVHPSHGVGMGGAAWMPGNELWAFMNTSGGWGASWYAPHGGATLAHEAGHSFGRGHVDCGGPDYVDAGYPYSVCDIGPDVENAYYGFKANSLAVIAPTHAGDLMSYAHSVGKPRWPSDYTYRALYTALSASASAAEVLPSALAEASEVLVATGIVTPTQGTGAFRSVYRMVQGTVADADLASAAASQVTGSAADTYALRLLSGSGATLAEQVFTPQPVPDYDGLDQPFMVVMPFDSSTARIAIVRNGVQIAERAVSLSAPTVQVLRPLGGETISGDLVIDWEATDPEGDPMRYTVQYSPDLGTTWQALATDHFTPTLTVEGDALAGSTQALIRVIANDGVNTGMAESAVFTVLPHAPRAVITQPEPMAVINPDTEVFLSGRSWDVEDGMLADASLTWTSDKDGVLGTGDGLAVRNLSSGLHRITLRATDSDGMIAAAMVQIYVRPSAPRNYLPMMKIE
jgi:hypothetical protein